MMRQMPQLWTQPHGQFKKKTISQSQAASGSPSLLQKLHQQLTDRLRRCR
jgi:hypothetical protein